MTTLSARRRTSTRGRVCSPRATETAASQGASSTNDHARDALDHAARSPLVTRMRADIFPLLRSHDIDGFEIRTITNVPRIQPPLLVKASSSNSFEHLGKPACFLLLSEIYVPLDSLLLMSRCFLGKCCLPILTQARPGRALKT